MAFYSEVEFSTDYLTLKSYKDSFSGPVLLDEWIIKKDNIESQLKQKAKNFPKQLRIHFEPEELIFKNLHFPYLDEKLIGQSVPFESRKYFKINDSEFSFTYHIWKRENDLLHLTLLGASCNNLEKYSPFVQAGFIPVYTINNYFTAEKEVAYQIISLGREVESIRFYYNGILTAWKTCDKKNKEESLRKGLEYIQTLGVSVSRVLELKPEEKLQGKNISLNYQPFQALLLKPVNKLFLQLSAVLASTLFLLYIISSVLNLSVQSRNLKLVENEISKLQNDYQITNLQSIRKKTEAKGVEISRVILTIGQKMPQDKKISRFEYENGEVSLTLRSGDVLEANRVREALETANGFSGFQVDEGVISNEKRIVFQVKR